MTNVRTQHPNAALTPVGRLKMVRLVIDDGWTIEAAASKFQVDAKTVRKWRDRYLAEGEAGLFDRSSRPHTSPNRTPEPCRRRIIELRKQRRWGADHIAFEVGHAASTVQRILVTEGLGRLDSGDRATKEPVIRYQRDRPGELVHVDVKIGGHLVSPFYFDDEPSSFDGPEAPPVCDVDFVSVVVAVLPDVVVLPESAPRSEVFAPVDPGCVD